MPKLKCIFGGHKYHPTETSLTWLHQDVFLVTAKCVNCGKINQFEVQIPVFEMDLKDGRTDEET